MRLPDAREDSVLPDVDHTDEELRRAPAPGDRVLMQEPDEEYREVQVGGLHTKRRGVALVDHADADAVGAYPWSMNANGYAKRNAQVGGKRLSVLMHREILGLSPGDGIQVDHVNGDKLDNRRANLRICTDAQNKQNLHQCGPYRGTHWHSQRGYWVAEVRLNGKKHHLGCFATRPEAAAVAAAHRREYMLFSADARDEECAA